MSELRDLISREIRAQATQERIRGTVLSAPEPTFFDPAGLQAYTYVCDVSLTKGRVLKQVPVKVYGRRARQYAHPGAPVFLERDAKGRYQVIGPADRGNGQGVVFEIDETTNTTASAGTVGTALIREPYTYYQGTPPETFFDPAADSDTLVWLRSYDRALGQPANIILTDDVDGAQILQLSAKAPSTLSALQSGSSVLRPLYRRFDGLLPQTLRSTADFDGSNDGLDFSGNVVESSPGELSIFMLCQKDGTGSGDDVLLETANFRVLSRAAAADEWGIDVGSGIESAGVQLTSTFVLVEVIASAFNAVTLYQGGLLLATITTAAAGLGLAQASLGYSAAAAGGTHNGRIAEVLVLDRAVNSTDRVAIEAYFNQTANVAFSRYANGIDGYPKLTVIES